MKALTSPAAGENPFEQQQQQKRQEEEHHHHDPPWPPSHQHLSHSDERALPLFPFFLQTRLLFRKATLTCAWHNLSRQAGLALC